MKIKIKDRVFFTHDKQKTGVVESVTPTGTYIVRLDKSPLKFFSLIEAQKHEIVLID